MKSLISYSQVQARVAATAGRLVAEGVVPGDRVALQVEKSPEAVMIYLATLMVGASSCPSTAPIPQVRWTIS